MFRTKAYIKRVYIQSKKQKANPEFLFIKIIYYTYEGLKKNYYATFGFVIRFHSPRFVCV